MAAVCWITGYDIRFKHYRAPSQGPCADSQLGLWKSTNSAGNINTAENNLLTDGKVNGKGGQAVISIYIYTLCRSVVMTENFQLGKLFVYILIHICCKCSVVLVNEYVNVCVRYNYLSAQTMIQPSTSYSQKQRNIYLLDYSNN